MANDTFNLLTPSQHSKPRSPSRGTSLYSWVLGATFLMGLLSSSTALGSHLSSSHVTGPNIQSGKSENPIPSGVHILHTQKRPSNSQSFTPNNQASGSRHIPNSESPRPPAPPLDSNNNGLKKALLHAKLGWNFLLNGRQKAAIAAYRQALQSNPNSARAYLGLGITLKGLGKVEIAKKAFLQAVNLDPRLPSALVHLGYLYAEGHFGKIDVKTARRLFLQASQLGDPFAGIALLDLQSHKSL